MNDNNLMVDLYSISDNSIKSIDVVDSMHKLYYLEMRLPTKSELNRYNSTMKLKEIVDMLSTNDEYVPLYDVYTENIYIIGKKNVYTRIINGNYRFPDELIIKTITKTMNSNKKKLKKRPKLKHNQIFMRKIRKAELMLNFLKNFDAQKLYTTYLKVFHQYAPDISNATFTCIRKSFIPHLGHLNPYYTRDEILKLGMNQGIISLPDNKDYASFKDDLAAEDYERFCDLVVKNDISAQILIDHQRYIIENDCAGLIQYYTAQGSYFMNQYLRDQIKYSYKNDYMEANIKKVWKLILGAPAFDNDYILYRFVDDDKYLKHLKIGDVYTERGFTSTTRDPFYKTDIYKFGFVLIKIHIAKNIKGVGLCLELLSHFPNEEEIILPPLSKLKLLSKDDKCTYYHPNAELVSLIKTRYEFEWIENGKLSLPERTEQSEETKTLNFLDLELVTTLTLKEKIDITVKKYFDPMNRIKSKIGRDTFYVVAEWYDSTGAYKDMYGITTSDGFCLYSIYDGYMLFMIEIGEHEGYRKMAVNYMNRYFYSKINRTYTDTEFIKFVSEIAYYFDVPNVTLYAEYAGCNIGRDMSNNKNTQADANTVDSEITDKINAFEYAGGNYCVDYYKYLKNNWKRFDDPNILRVELQPRFSYDDLDELKNIDPLTILKKDDRDEIYQIYVKSFRYGLKKTSNDNLAYFYCWMIENACYLLDILVDKFGRYFRDTDPFKKDVYVLDPITYLYNRGYIKLYNRYIKFDIDEERYPKNLPKNRVRFQR